MKLELQKTKRGNVCMDLFEIPALEAVLLERNQEIKTIFKGKDKDNYNEECFVVIPQRGMLLQIDGELFNLVKIDREFTGDEDDFTSVQEAQRQGEFDYSAVLIPSRKFTSSLRVFWKNDNAQVIKNDWREEDD